MLPFAFADRYDPKKDCEHTCWVLVTTRKFFHDTQSQGSCSLKSFFYGIPGSLIDFAMDGCMNSEKTVASYLQFRII